MHSLEKDPIALLEEVKELLILKGENRFKIQAYEKAIEHLSIEHNLFERAKANTLKEIPGVGKSIAGILEDYLLRNSTAGLDALKAALPEGLFELSKVPGLGPKKALQVIQTLNIHTLEELEEACLSKKLEKVKGIGKQIQTKVQQNIFFTKASLNKILLSEGLAISQKILETFRSRNFFIEETGALRRRCEVLSELDFIAKPPLDVSTFHEWVKTQEFNIPIRIFISHEDYFGWEWLKTTGSESHWQKLNLLQKATSEESLYQSIGISWIPPEMREGGKETEITLSHFDDSAISGVFHVHTDRSDGKNSLEEMVIAAKQMKFQYIGISDHSQTAVYASGLKKNDLLQQKKEIDQLQDKYEIHIFWGIESDILEDGSLDYDAKTLAQFDFVIASIHSRFQMDKDAMTNRIVQAIRNPACQFLGHATGRLLLVRPGYAVDLEQIIQVASENKVAIELNSNPNRLDIDWRWGDVLKHFRAEIAINPDAHSIAGLKDIRYGTWMARKALLFSSQIVNHRPLDEVKKWLKRR